MHTPVPLEFGQYYHIYNRGVARTSLFLEERNYRHFLRLYAHHVGSVVDTFAYSLLPNHFHFLVQIKDLTGPQDLSGLDGVRGRKPPSRCYSDLFNAYAKAFNAATGRTGTLFQRPFGRIPVTSDAYFTALTVYIHHNPQRHGLAEDFRAWPYSSYGALLSSRPTRLARDQVLAWFGDTEEFVRAHSVPPADGTFGSLIADDFE